MNYKSLVLVLVTAELLLTTGCSGPLKQLGAHIDTVSTIYVENTQEPATGLRVLFRYLEANNPSIRALVTNLRSQLSALPNGTNRKRYAEEIYRHLRPRRERLFQVRSSWQKIAILDPATSEQMRNLGSIPVQEAQTAFDESVSALFRDIQRMISF